jgi:hypothetical protein
VAEKGFFLLLLESLKKEKKRSLVPASANSGVRKLAWEKFVIGHVEK